MLDIIKKLLIEILENIDSGNTNITEEEEVKTIKVLKELLRKDVPMSKYQAYTYLNISRATFDNLVNENKLPKGKKIAGFKELMWCEKDLIMFLKNNK